jgi:hypothetical protein
MVVGVIRSDCSRHDDWIKVFGTDRVQLLSQTATLAMGPHGRAAFYKGDVRALPNEVFDRLVEHLAARFSLPAEEVRGQLCADLFFPVLSEDVTVEVHAQHHF